MNWLGNKRGSTLGIVAGLVVIFGVSALAGFYLIGPGLAKRNPTEQTAQSEETPSVNINTSEPVAETPKPAKSPSADDISVSVSISEDKAATPPISNQEEAKKADSASDPEVKVAGSVEEFTSADQAKPEKPKPTQPAEANKPVEKAPPASAVTKPASKPGSWRVQVGVFSDKQTADSLAKNLQAKGEQAHVATTTIDGKPAYRVQAGIFSKRENADALSNRLKGEGFQPTVVEQTASGSAKP